MLIHQQHFRSIWRDRQGVAVIDQTLLPFEFRVHRIDSLAAAAEAITSMRVRGAPLIGMTAAYGMALALRADPTDDTLARAREMLLATRPTAVNLRWALSRMQSALRTTPPAARAEQAFTLADRWCDEDVATNRRIGEHGATLIRQLAESRSGPVNILTHCNAGALATVDYGTALAAVYTAHDTGLPLHVWVDETRPRNQGAALTAWELGQHGVRHTVISDNSGGHLMQRGQVDLCLVGSDRTTAAGDVCNKIGTYQKALAAADNRVPFYACLPASTIDWAIRDGMGEIPIEERHSEELSHVSGITAEGVRTTVRITPADSPVANHAFDVTPARLVTALVTEHGIFRPDNDGMGRLRELAGMGGQADE